LGLARLREAIWYVGRSLLHEHLAKPRPSFDCCARGRGGRFSVGRGQVCPGSQTPQVKRAEFVSAEGRSCAARMPARASGRGTLPWICMFGAGPGRSRTSTTAIFFFARPPPESFVGRDVVRRAGPSLSGGQARGGANDIPVEFQVKVWGVFAVPETA